MNPEFFEHISERLFKAGASDVFLTNIIMKKGRPAVKLSVILEKENAGDIKEILFTESTTLGIRSFPFLKDTLMRKFDTIETIWGKITVKRSFYKDREVSAKPEYDECKAIALKDGLTVREVYNNIMAEIIKQRKN
jgi:uncharacterized protein (DUF111 family)